MNVVDPIADMLTRVRNAQMAAREVVEVPHSGIIAEISRILKREGYITDYSVEGGKKKTLRVYLKYAGDKTPAIRKAKRMSASGYRRYVGWRAIPRVLGGLGVAILSTPAGVLTGAEARKRRVGGELLCLVW